MDSSTDTATADDQHLIELAVEIASAFVSRNSVGAAELPHLITVAHTALVALRSSPAQEPPEEQRPAIAIRKSITPEHLICLEDGKKFKSLKRHLGARHDLSPQEYREKWGLARDYPMVAPNYSTSRSQLAKSNGLGRKKGFKPSRRRPI